MIVHVRPCLLTFSSCSRGSEFKAAPFQSLLRSRGIQHKYASNTEKASLAERGLGTLLRRLHRYMVYNNSLRFIDVLQDMTRSLNATPHSSLLFRAPDSITQDTLYPVWESYYLKHAPNQKKINFKFSPGDRVRISRARSALDKAYRGTYSQEIFTVLSRRHTRPPSYQLADINHSLVEGMFYEPEMIKVTDRHDQLYTIRDVLRRFRDPDSGERMAEVTWDGWPKAHRSIIRDDSIVETGRRSSERNPFAPATEAQAPATPRPATPSPAASRANTTPRVTRSGMTLRPRRE